MRDALRIVAAEEIEVVVDGRKQKMRKARAAAMALFGAAIDGDVAAIKEISDRLDGKVAIQLAGDRDNPIQHVQKIEVEIVRSPNADR